MSKILGIDHFLGRQRLFNDPSGTDADADADADGTAHRVLRHETSELSRLIAQGWSISGLSPDHAAPPTVGFTGLVRLRRGDECMTLGIDNIEKAMICFTPGTQIATSKGMIRVEDLRGDEKVITRDNAYQRLIWVGRQDLRSEELTLLPYLQPILIRKDAIDTGVPNRDVLVSPNHRILIRSNRAASEFGHKEVLVAARDLTCIRGVDRVQTQEVSYIHLLFERHELIMSDVLWTESLQLGPRAISGLGRQGQEKIRELFPKLEGYTSRDTYQQVRRCLSSDEVRMIAR